MNDDSAFATGRFAEVDGAIDDVIGHLDVAAVIRRMREDLAAHPDAWENHTLDRFLEALGAVMTDLPGFFHNQRLPMPQQPSWQLMAQVLVSASGYE